MTASSPLLIWHPGALGDLVSIFPLIRALRRCFHPLSVICQGSLGRLAAAEGLVDSWHPIEAAWTASLFGTEAAPAAHRILAPFTRLLVFSWSEALAAGLHRVAGAETCRIPPRPPVDGRIHICDHVRQHLSSWGLIPENHVDRPEHEEPLPASSPAGGPRVVMLHPGAGNRRKRWPLEGFLEIAADRRRNGEIPIFIIGPAEEDLLDPIARSGLEFHRPADAVELLALLRSAAAYIGNDSGVSHLAAWAGIPSVVIFGPTDPGVWAPRGRMVLIVQPPAEDRMCPEGLIRVTPEQVLNAYQRAVRAG